MTTRVLLAGLFHETNCFVPETTGLADFKVERDAALLARRGDGSQVDGFREVADRLSISTATVHRLIQVRDLDHLRLGRRTIRIPESALHDYLTRCTVRRLR